MTLSLSDAGIQSSDIKPMQEYIVLRGRSDSAMIQQAINWMVRTKGSEVK